MKNAARILYVSAFAGAAMVFSSCNNGGSGGGGMYVQSCTLGCTNGAGGNQVSCGIINTFQNQDVAVVFSEAVDKPSLLVNSAFQVVDTVTGSNPPGTRLVDQANDHRAIFRPKLSFDASGNPSFGFSATSSYQVRIPGTAQGDSGPFVRSSGGQSNESRLLCTITTDQGLIDPVPGSPTVSLFVEANGVDNPINLDTLRPDPDSSGVVVPTFNVGANLVLAQVRSGAGSANDPLDPPNPIVMVFNDVMNVGTLLFPASGQSPFISVKIDPDGDVVGTPDDLVPIGGSYSFEVDQNALTTTLRFQPSGGWPSAGVDIANPRVVVIDIPAAVKDLAGHSVANISKRMFVPQVIGSGDIVLPTGGEQFTSTTNMDARRTSAHWGEETAGRLTAGPGGGSGRLGDLVLGDGQTRNVFTEHPKAVARFKFSRNPKVADAAAIMINNGPLHLLKKTPAAATDIPFDDFLTDTLSEIVRYCENPANLAVDPQLAFFDFTVEGVDTVLVTAATAGSAGNNFTMACFPVDLISLPPLVAPSGQQSVQHPADTNWDPLKVPYFRLNLVNGADTPLGPTGSSGIANLIDRRNFLTNLTFSALNPPIATAVPDAVIEDGRYEFTLIQIGANASLSSSGVNPLQLFARGQFSLSDTALINVAGADRGGHSSEASYGQLGALPGPGGGRGGQGGDRPDNTEQTNLLNLPNCTTSSCGGSTTNPLINHGITNLGAVVDGRAGQGVGGALGYGPGASANLGSGLGGAHWPNTFPSDTLPAGWGNLDVVAAACESQQIGGSGSGGAYTTDGGIGVAVSSTPLGINLTSNTPANTAGGDSSVVVLEPPATPGPQRKLTPSQGYLRGGAGGGGGGSSLFGTRTNGSGGCLAGTAAINWFRTHSGAGGGGGGGAVQVIGGRVAQINGRIDASGGDGGSMMVQSPTPVPYGQHSTPGGGGSGGAILIQSKDVALNPLQNRLTINGGLGGTGPVFAGAFSSGGAGGTGLLRVEDNSGAVPADIEPSVNPNGGANFSEDWVSVGTWSDQTVGPEAISGAESCWLKAASSGFFALQFHDDSAGDGWDMDVLLDFGAGVQTVSYRSSTIYGSQSPEDHWGNLIDDGTLVPPQAAAPIIVRFQGAKSVGVLTQSELCDLNLADTQKVAFGSVTTWVMHPEELNHATTKPDMVRFQILFDRSHSDFANIRGVTNLRIHVTPD